MGNKTKNISNNDVHIYIQYTQKSKMTREREREIKQMNSPRGFKNIKKKGQNQTRTKPEQNQTKSEQNQNKTRTKPEHI